jgi:hypothetical protein
MNIFIFCLIILAILILILAVLQEGNLRFQKDKNSKDLEYPSEKMAYSKLWEKDVYIGDIWTLGHKNLNPFEKYKIKKFLVVDIKNNYIKYKYLEPGLMKNYVFSDCVDFFLCNKDLEYRKSNEETKNETK